MPLPQPSGPGPLQGAKRVIVLAPWHKPRSAFRDQLPVLLRVPFPLYGHLVAWLSEYFATTFFFFLALSGEQIAMAATRNESDLPPHLIQLLYSSLSQGFAFAVTSWAFFRITSGLFNPAITLGMCLIRSLSWIRAAWVILAQLLGAMTGAAFVRAVFEGPFLPRAGLDGGTMVVKAFWAELLLTTALVFLVFLLASDKHKGALLAPIALGLALFTVILCGGVYHDCSLNPARALAVSIMAHSFPSYHWIYWVASCIGSLFAALLYELTKQLELETSDAKHRAVEADEKDLLPDNNSPAAAPGSGQSGHQLEVVPEHAVDPKPERE